MQQRCLRLLYERKTGGEIAQILEISKSTVESHLAAARRTLGVTTSVKAALIFNEFDSLEHPSRNLTTDNARVGESTELAPPFETANGAPWWQLLLPIRRSGEKRNALTITQRLTAWLIVALALAVGFGSLANGVRIVSDLALRAHIQ